jgi:predicted metal-dependent hydrolase
MDYIVVHELAHRKVLNHSRAFWSEVALYYPAYKSAEKDLRRYWIIIERNRWWNAIQNAKGGK